MSRFESSLYQPIIDALGATKIETETHYSVDFMLKGRRCSMNLVGDKITFWIHTAKPAEGMEDASHYESDKIYDSLIHPIKVSASRSPQDIAKDVLRRLNFSEYDRYLSIYRQEENDHRNYLLSVEEIATEINDIIGQGMTGTGDVWVEARGDWYTNYKTPIRVSGTSVEFSLRGISNRDMIRELAQVIGKYAKIPTAQLQ